MWVLLVPTRRHISAGLQLSKASKEGCASLQTMEGCSIGCDDDERARLRRGHKKGIVLFMPQMPGGIPFNFCFDQIWIWGHWWCKPPTGSRESSETTRIDA